MRSALVAVRGIAQHRAFFTSECVRALAGVLLTVWAALFGLTVAAFGQTTVSVTDYGARGDAVHTLATTVQNSSVITLSPPTALSAADVGKLILLFGAGAQTTATNYQDLITTIAGVADGTNVTMATLAGASATNIDCTYGTQNAGPFQQCLDACTGTNTLVTIPPGTYLFMPPWMLDPTRVMTNPYEAWPTVIIRKGGITLLGADPSNTTLLGNGAWLLKGPYVQRGALIMCIGPITNNFPLVFQNLTFDGGVSQGRQSYYGYPARTNDGAGWDNTHHAVINEPPAPFYAVEQFLNCRFLHWRGEMAYNGTSFDSGIIQVTNCWFVDGNADGYNMSWTPHVISGCLFSNLFQPVEYYVGTMQRPSLFVNNTITDVTSACSLVGGLTNHLSPGYTIQSNIFSRAGKYGVLLGPACNVTITGNRFIGVAHGIGTDGAAYQGTDYNHDITVASNSFEGTYMPISIGGDGRDRLVNMTVKGNTASGCYHFGFGYGWCSNVVFLANTSASTSGQPSLDSAQLTGQWFLDDVCNHFQGGGASDNVGQTNIVSYAYGIHETLWTATTNSAFLLDDQYPLRIPPGARLEVTHLGRFPVLLYSSSTSPVDPPKRLLTGDTASFSWQNGRWISIPNPVGNVRVRKP